MRNEIRAKLKKKNSNNLGYANWEFLPFATFWIRNPLICDLFPENEYSLTWQTDKSQSIPHYDFFQIYLQFSVNRCVIFLLNKALFSEKLI